jgi:methylmalonyl-CoA/ethylmalonyl-CoA epimerase
MDMRSLSNGLERIVIKKLDHIGIAVKSIDETLNKWRALFGVKAQHIETVKEHLVRVAFVPIGGILIEFLEPSEPGAGVIAEFLEKHGEGFNHIAYRVEGLETLLTHMKQKGVSLSGIYHKDERPRRGSRDSLIAFLNQEETNNVFIELVEMKDEPA